MGYVFAFSPCYGCKQPFSYNPNLVPSIRVEGLRQPICRNCVDRVNPIREKNRLDPIVVLSGAYEACAEEELP